MPILPQELDQLFEGRAQGLGQGVGRVDQEDAAGGQAGALHLGVALQRHRQGGRLARLDRQGGVQPGLAGLLRQGAQALGQVMRFRPTNHRVPHQVGAGGKAFEAVLDGGGHACVVGLEFVAGIQQHQATTAGRWQEFLQSVKAILAQHGHSAPGLELRHVLLQQLGIAGQEFKELDFVLLSQEVIDHEGGAGIAVPLTSRVELGHQVQVVLEQGRGCLIQPRQGSDQSLQTLGRLGAGLRPLTV